MAKFSVSFHGRGVHLSRQDGALLCGFYKTVHVSARYEQEGIEKGRETVFRLLELRGVKPTEPFDLSVEEVKREPFWKIWGSSGFVFYPFDDDNGSGVESN